jgi:hypothetical protein
MIGNDSLAQLVASSRSFQLLTEMRQDDVALRRRVEISMTLREELAGCERALETIATELSNGDCPPEAAVWAAIEYGLAAGVSDLLHKLVRKSFTGQDAAA